MSACTLRLHKYTLKTRIFSTVKHDLGSKALTVSGQDGEAQHWTIMTFTVRHKNTRLGFKKINTFFVCFQVTTSVQKYTSTVSL